jgi:hypothetical protein
MKCVLLFDFQIIDDKSLIKKYQKQICSLKQELEQVKRGTLVSSSQEDIVTLKEKVFSFTKYNDFLYTNLRAVLAFDSDQLFGMHDVGFLYSLAES